MKPSAFSKREGASLAAAVWATLYVVVALWCTRRGESLPPDSTDYAEVARSLVRGQGTTINHVAFHTYLFPAVRHTLEVHGLLAPFQIAPLFAIWGPVGGLVRIPSIVFMGCLGFLVYRTARELAGSFAGLVATTLVLVRPDLLFIAVLGADDIGSALFALLALYCFQRSEMEDRRWILATGVASAVAGLQKFTGLLCPAAFAAFLLFGARRELTSARARRRWLAAAVLPASVVGLYVLRNVHVYGTLGSPYGGVEWFGKRSFTEYFAYYPKPTTVSAAWAVLGRAKVLSLINEQLHAVLVVFASDPVYSVGLPALGWLAWRRPRFAVCALLFIAGVVFIVCVPHHLEARYLAPLTPIFAISTGALCATVAARLSDAVRASHRRWLWLALGAALAGYAIPGISRTVATMRALGEAMKAGPACADALSFLRHASTEKEPVLTSNPWFIAWSAERPAVNAPTNGPWALLTVARHYGARWVFTGVRVAGALDLDVALRDAPIVNGLRPILEFHGSGCDVYGIDPGARP